MNDQRTEQIEGVEGQAAHEIAADEDVLSYSAREALEQVGSATGFVLALALVVACLPRAAKLLAASASALPGTPTSLAGEDRDARAIERRALDAGQGATVDGAPLSEVGNGAFEQRAFGGMMPTQSNLGQASGGRHV